MDQLDLLLDEAIDEFIKKDYLQKCDIKNEHFCTFDDYFNYFKENYSNIVSYNEAISLNKVNLFKKKMKNDEELLKSKNVNTTKINKIIQTHAKEFTDEIKGLKFSKDNLQAFSDITKKCVSETQKDVIETVLENLERRHKKRYSGDNEYISALVIFLDVYTINLLMYLILAVLFGPIAGTIIGYVLIFPITEELGRCIAVRTEKDHSGMKYNLVLNIAKLTLFFTKGYGASTTLLIKTPSIVLNTLNTIINSKTYKKNQDKVNKNTSGFIISAILHGLFNALCCQGVALVIAKAI